MRRTWERRVVEAAARRHGLLTRQQALALGMSSGVLRGLVERGTLVRLHPGVFALAGSLHSPQRQALAAALACGPDAVVSHRSAVVIWDIELQAPEPEVTIPAERRRSVAGVRVYRTRRLSSTDVRRIDGIPVTAPMRTLTDLMRVVPEAEAERVLDVMHRRRIIDLRALDRYLGAAANLCLPGIPALRAIVADRNPDRPIESELETDLFHVLRVGGLPLPAQQHPVKTRRGVRRVDFAYVDEQLAIEADGYVPHTDRETFEDDRIRQNLIEEAGWSFRRFTKKQLRGAPLEVVITIGTALGLMPRSWRSVPSVRRPRP